MSNQDVLKILREQRLRCIKSAVPVSGLDLMCKAAIEEIESLRAQLKTANDQTDKADNLINQIYECGILLLEQEGWVQEYLGIADSLNNEQKGADNE